jgi:phage-related protein
MVRTAIQCRQEKTTVVSFDLETGGGKSQEDLPGRERVAYTCNLSYSRGRDQEDLGSKPAPANSPSVTQSRKKSITKNGLVEWLKV